MKALLIVLTFIVTLSSRSFAEIPAPLWIRTIGSADNEEGFAICRMSSGNIMIGGRHIANGIPYSSPMLTCLTADGDSVWSRILNTELNWDSTSVYDLVTTTNGGFLAAGSGGYHYSNGPFLTRFNAAADTMWHIHYGNMNVLKVNAVAELTDGGIALIGNQFVFTGLDVIYLIGLAATGGIRWTRTNATDIWSRGNAVVATPDTGFTVAGGIGLAGPDTSQSAGYLVHYNSRGLIVWSRTYGSSQHSEFKSVKRTSDGGYILAGYSNAFGFADYDAWVVRTNSVGDLLWEQHLGTRQDEVAACLADVDPGYVIAGCGYTDEVNGNDGFLARLSVNGTVDWSGTIGGSQFDCFQQIVAMPDGSVIVAGTTLSFGSGGSDVYALRIPPGSGWVGTITDRATHRPLSGVSVSVIGHSETAVTNSHGFYSLFISAGTYDLITYSACTARDTLRNLTVATAVVDTLNWEVDQPQSYVSQSSLNLFVHNHVIGSAPLLLRNDGPGLLDYSFLINTVYPHGNWLSVDPPSGSLAAGDSINLSVVVDADTSDNSIMDYYGIVTIRENSCPDTLRRVAVFATVLDAGDRPAAAPLAFSLTAYPNPFNPSTTVSFSLPQREEISLALYDLAGRQVAVLRQGVLETGSYSERFDGSRLPSGIYFARLQSPTRSQTRKLMLLK